jgi:hypothetical protein
MINEINLIAAGVAAATVSGVAGLLITALAMRRTQLADENVAWEKHQSAELARSLLVLELAGDQIESPAVDIAVRARLTPAEMAQATEELTAAGLIEEPSPNLLRLTDGGRRVLMQHKFELELEDSALHRHRGKGSQRQGQSPEDLDLAIEATVESLRAQHAH